MKVSPFLRASTSKFSHGLACKNFCPLIKLQLNTPRKQLNRTNDSSYSSRVDYWFNILNIYILFFRFNFQEIIVDIFLNFNDENWN